MTTYRITEEDSGSYTRSPHRHNGYYAGDFGTTGHLLSRTPRTIAVIRTAAHPSDGLPA